MGYREAVDKLFEGVDPVIAPTGNEADIEHLLVIEWVPLDQVFGAVIVEAILSVTKAGDANKKRAD